MTFAKTIFIGAIAIFSSVATHGVALYKWVDENGKTSYHDRPPPENSGYRVEQKEWHSAEQSDSDPSEKFPITLYSSPGCALCDAARAYLEKRNVPFTEKNVEANVALQKELKAKSGSLLVPTLVVGDRVMNSYIESLLASELDRAGYPKKGAGAPDAGASENADPSVGAASGKSDNNRRY